MAEPPIRSVKPEDGDDLAARAALFREGDYADSLAMARIRLG